MHVLHHASAATVACKWEGQLRQATDCCFLGCAHHCSSQLLQLHPGQHLETQTVALAGWARLTVPAGTCMLAGVPAVRNRRIPQAFIQTRHQRHTDASVFTQTCWHACCMGGHLRRRRGWGRRWGWRETPWGTGTLGLHINVVGPARVTDIRMPRRLGGQSHGCNLT